MHYVYTVYKRVLGTPLHIMQKTPPRCTAAHQRYHLVSDVQSGDITNQTNSIMSMRHHVCSDTPQHGTSRWMAPHIIHYTRVVGVLVVVVVVVCSMTYPLVLLSMLWQVLSRDSLHTCVPLLVGLSQDTSQHVPSVLETSSRDNPLTTVHRPHVVLVVIPTYHHYLSVQQDTLYLSDAGVYVLPTICY